MSHKGNYPGAMETKTKIFPTQPTATRIDRDRPVLGQIHFLDVWHRKAKRRRGSDKRRDERVLPSLFPVPIYSERDADRWPV